MITATDADELTPQLARLLRDALEIEGQPIELRRVSPRKIMLYVGRDRYELTVVKKR